MAASRTKPTLCAIVAAAAVAMGGRVALAEQQATSYQPGDRVEVHSLNRWLPGTVVGASDGMGWVDVRLDDDPHVPQARDMPEGISDELRLQFQENRGRLLTRPYRSDDVRPAKTTPTRTRRQAAAQPTGELRTWTDRSGRFSVEARFTGLADGKVTLANTGGKRVEVPLDRLCEADARYVQDLQRSSENPFQEVPAPRRDGVSAREASPRQGNWHGAKTIRPRTFSRWTFVPEGQGEAAVRALADIRDQSVDLGDVPDSDKFFEGVAGLYVSADGHWAAVGRVQGKVARERNEYLEVVDLQRGKPRGLTPLPGSTTLLDVLPSDALVMYRPDEFGFGKNTLLTIARLKGGQLVPVAQWEPYSNIDWEPGRDVEKAWFLGPDRVLTANQHAEALTVWDVASAKALVSVPVQHTMDNELALSSDRRYLAIVMDDGIAIIDLQDAKHVATLPTEGNSVRRIAFRDDNCQLAGVSDQSISVWDLTTGDKAVEFYPPSLRYGDDLAWAGEFVLVGNQYLFDTERRILLWEYLGSLGGGAESATLHDGRMWIVPKLERNRQATLVSVAIPHPAARRKASRLPSAEELLVVRPGDEVSIETDINARGISSDEVRQLLASALEDAGLHVVDDAPLVVKAVCKPQERQRIRINTDRRLPVREKDIVERTITPHASQLEMTLDGATVWKRGYVARPGYIFFLEKGESLDQALDRLTKPNPSLFKNFKFNGYIARPGTATEGGAYGVSQLTDAGVVDGDRSGRRAAF